MSGSLGSVVGTGGLPLYIYIHIHLTTPSKFIFFILGSMGPPPWEDNTVPLAPDGGHYVNACSSIYVC